MSFYDFAMPLAMPRFRLLQLISLPLLFLTLHVSAYDVVNLQLKWKHQFQLAGYYAAKVKGYYQDAGLDVHIIEAYADIGMLYSPFPISRFSLST